MDQKTGTAAALSIIAAIASFFLTFSGHRLFALILAVVSIPLGIVGFLAAASPRVRGGIMSIAAMVLGVIAIGVAVLGMIGAAIF